jgi:hypothetical protein
VDGDCQQQTAAQRKRLGKGDSKLSAEAGVWGDTTELARYEAIPGTHISCRAALKLSRERVNRMP